MDESSQRSVGLVLICLWHLMTPPAMATQDPLEQLINQLTRAGHQQALPGMQAEESLLAAIEAYQAIRRLGGWISIPDGPVLAPGQMSARTELIRQRLKATGDLEPFERSPGNFYDHLLAAGVRRFQARHGLRVDARVGRETLVAMNVPASARLAQLRRNLARVRILRRAVVDQSRYVMVNIPAFQLVAVGDDAIEMTSSVIVGRKDRQTPLLNTHN